MDKTIAVLGGDIRQVRLAQLLLEEGRTVVTWGLEKGGGPRPAPLDQALEAQIIILPLPVLRQGRLTLPLTDSVLAPEDLWPRLKKEQLLLGGAAGSLAEELRETWGLTLVDYTDREEFLVANAVLTAEGAVLRAMEETEAALCQSRCLIVGGGRIGKLLCQRLHLLGAQVTVAARSPKDRAWADAFGCRAVDLQELPAAAEGTDILFNTVPTVLLRRDVLAALPPHAKIFDLASLPGGVDMEAAAELKRQPIRLPGLPGRTAPLSAAKAMLRSINEILEERGNDHEN